MDAWNKFTQQASQAVAGIGANAAPMGEKLTRGFGNWVSIAACSLHSLSPLNLRMLTSEYCCTDESTEPASKGALRRC